MTQGMTMSNNSSNICDFKSHQEQLEFLQLQYLQKVRIQNSSLISFVTLCYVVCNENNFHAVYRVCVTSVSGFVELS